jgi:hypothetical protein
VPAVSSPSISHEMAVCSTWCFLFSGVDRTTARFATGDAERVNLISSPSLAVHLRAVGSLCLPSVLSDPCQGSAGCGPGLFMGSRVGAVGRVVVSPSFASHGGAFGGRASWFLCCVARPMPVGLSHCWLASGGLPNKLGRLPDETGAVGDCTWSRPLASRQFPRRGFLPL